jgi:hypothetical protein
MIRSLAQTPAAVSAETQPHPSRVLCIRLRKTCRSFEMVSSPYAVARLIKKPVRTRRRLTPFVGVAQYSRKCTCCIGTDTPENGRMPFTTPPLRAGSQGAKVELRMGGSNSYAGSKASRHPRKQRNLEGERFWQLLRRKLRPQRFTGGGLSGKELQGSPDRLPSPDIQRRTGSRVTKHDNSNTVTHP